LSAAALELYLYGKEYCWRRKDGVFVQEKGGKMESREKGGNGVKRQRKIGERGKKIK
jgi:hypothetical protein